MRKFLLTFLGVALAVSVVFAQEKTVSGKVTAEDGSGLPGVNVILKGTTSGAVTDVEGNFKLEVPESGAVLVFSFIGFRTVEMEVGNQSVFDVQLEAESTQLTEVVVTALGISREKASLGYSVVTVGSEDVARRPDGDVGRLLRGKVPGVEITGTSGLAGAGTNIIIRGYSSITGNNQPLFIVDGVAFGSSTDSDRGFTTGGATASSRFLDLDPNNIEEISVLKGLSATVLYGEAGRNGVILITTKTGGKGTSNKKFEVSFTQSVFGVQAAGIPETQDKYGNGWQNFASAAFSNWGAPFDEPDKNGLGASSTSGSGAPYPSGEYKHPYDRSALRDAFPQYVGAGWKYQPYDNYSQFFKTGTTASTNLAIGSQIDQNTSVNFSYGYLSDDGYVPNNVLKRHTASLGLRTTLANKLTFSGTFNYVNSQRDTPPAGISTSSNPAGASLFSNIMYTPRSWSLEGLEYENPVDGSSIYYRSGNDIQHPFWTLNNTNDAETLDRFYTTLNFGYDIKPWLNVFYRLGYDNYVQRQVYTVNSRGRQIPDGLMETSVRTNTIIDNYFALNFDYDINSDWSITGILGVNDRSEKRDTRFTSSTVQFIFDLFTHDNFIEHQARSSIRELATIGVFGTAAIGYRNFLYLNLQARNDWTSTLEEENRSVLYPSASLSWMVFESMGMSTTNNLKVRLGYGTSAGYPPPYQTRNVLGTSPNDFVTNGGTIVNSNSLSNRFGNTALTRELHKEVEVGIEGSFLNNRVSFDLSVYDKSSEDLIIDLELDPSTGFTQTTVNTAELSNQGVELGLTVVPVQTGDWTWSITSNFTTWKTTIDALADGIEQALIAGQSWLGNFAIPG